MEKINAAYQIVGNREGVIQSEATCFDHGEDVREALGLVVRDDEDIAETLLSVGVLLHGDHNVQDFGSEDILLHHRKLPA